MMRRISKTIGYALTIGLAGFAEHSSSEPNREQNPVTVPNTTSTADDSQLQQAIEAIAHEYFVEVKTIFKTSCFDCHTNLTSYPWYYTLPLVKTKIDRDIEEAREHLDFSNDYPFMSKKNLAEDLKAIARTIEDDSMPPLPYALFHRTKTMAPEQKEKVISWIEESLKLLSNAGYVASID
jgi:hypothetical protein